MWSSVYQNVDRSGRSSPRLLRMTWNPGYTSAATSNFTCGPLLPPRVAAAAMRAFSAAISAVKGGNGGRLKGGTPHRYVRGGRLTFDR